MSFMTFMTKVVMGSTCLAGNFAFSPLHALSPGDFSGVSHVPCGTVTVFGLQGAWAHSADRHRTTLLSGMRRHLKINLTADSGYGTGTEI